MSCSVGCLERIITLDAFDGKNSNSSLDKLLIFTEAFVGILLIHQGKGPREKKDSQKTDVGVEKSTKTLKITKLLALNQTQRKRIKRLFLGRE